MNDKRQQAQAKQLVLDMYDAGASADEIVAASGWDRKQICHIICDSGRVVAFRPYGRPDTPPAREFAENWTRTTNAVMRKISRKWRTA